MNIRLLRFPLILLFALLLQQSHAQCEYRLDMFDTAGDGWNGSFLTITVGSTSHNLSLTAVFDDGPYTTLPISNYRYKKWYTLVMRHIHDYQAPIVMHPILLKRYFSYLAGDASGHYQVGRGYAKRGDKPDLVGYFEPWNQRRFDPSEPFIKRVQWHLAYQSFRANKAHPYHNIGV